MEAIIFLIIAAIVGMVNNKKKTEQAEPKPVPKATTLEKAEPEKKERRPRNARESMDRAANELQKEYDRQRESIESSKPQRAPREVTVESSFSRPERERTVREKKKAAPQTDLHLEKGLSQDDIVRGVVMAEILGPPRAKRSHARSRM